LAGWAKLHGSAGRIIQDVTLEEVESGAFDPELQEFAWATINESTEFFRLLQRNRLISSKLNGGEFLRLLQDPRSRGPLMHKVLLDILTLLSDRVLQSAIPASKSGKAEASPWVVAPDAVLNQVGASDSVSREAARLAGDTVVPKVIAIDSVMDARDVRQVENLVQKLASEGHPVNVTHVNNPRVMVSVLYGAVVGLVLRLHGIKGKKRVSREAIRSFSDIIVTVSGNRYTGGVTHSLKKWFKKSGVDDSELEADNALVLLAIYQYVFAGRPLPATFEKLSPDSLLQLENIRRFVDGIEKDMGVRPSPTLLVEQGLLPDNVLENKSWRLRVSAAISSLISAKQSLERNFRPSSRDLRAQDRRLRFPIGVRSRSSRT
jgi:hypothetical protein